MIISIPNYNGSSPTTNLLYDFMTMLAMVATDLTSYAWLWTCFNQCCICSELILDLSQLFQTI